MGRHSTGAVTTGEVTRLELSYLLKNGILKQGGFSCCILSWTNGSKMNCYSNLGEAEDDRFIRLTYSFRAWGDGQAIQKDYKIYLTYLPSNLGKGKVPYFVCPSSGRRARVLYMCYGSPIFKCRDAYSNRIYYQCQQSSRLNYHNDRYWKLDKELQKCMGKSRKATYQGKPTRLKQRIAKLRDKKEYHDYLRWTILPKSMQKHLPDFFF